MTTAFVLSGGGSLGAIQVGMLRALSEHGMRPDLLIGTSAGALNATYLSRHGTEPDALAGLATRWIATRRRDVFPIDPRRHTLAVVGARNSLFSDRGLRRLIARDLAGRRLEDARVPVHVVATDALTGEEVRLSHGDAVSAVLASTSIPGMLPPVERDGRVLVDGGLADNTAISQAVALGAERVFVLPAGVACALTEPPRTALGAALHALTFLTQQRLITDAAAYADEVELHVLPPLCPMTVPPTSFGHAAELITRAHAVSRTWLERGDTRPQHPERLLSLHRHRGAPTHLRKGSTR